jgi:hypothetical protein
VPERLPGVKSVEYAKSADTFSDAAKFAALPIPEVAVQGKSDLQTHQKYLTIKIIRYKSFAISELYI